MRKKQKLSGRRVKGDGSVFQRPNGSWAYVLDLGRDKETGKRKRRMLVAKTRVELKRRIEDEVARNGGSIRAKAAGTIGELIEAWLTNDVAVNLSPNTYRNYRTLWTKYAEPRIGHCTLEKFDIDDVEALFAGLRADGASASVVQRVATVMHRGIEAAIEKRRYNRTNPFSLVKKPKHRPKEARALDSDEAPRFLAAAEGDRYEALWLLLITGGLRLGEALALRWSDIDFKRQLISVNRAFIEVKGGIEIKAPKNDGSRRAIDLDEYTMAALHKRQAEAKAEPHGSELVFPTLAGTPLRRSNLRRSHFTPILKKAALGHLRIHDLRHSMTSLLIAAGVSPKVIAERLGHTTTRLVMDRYSHILPGLQRQAAESIGLAVRNKKDKPLSP